MKFTSIATFALAALGVSAAPTPGGGDWKNNNCFSRSYIEGIVAKEIIFLQHLNVAEAVAVGYEIFDAGIQEYGDSINSLRGDPLGTRVEDGAARYIEETTSTPPIPQIDTLSLTVECNTYVWQWRFYGIGPPTAPNPYIQGFTYANVSAAGQIYYQYVEFNSLAWAANSGYTITPPTTGPYAAPS